MRVTDSRGSNAGESPAHGAPAGTCHNAGSRSRGGNPGNFPYARLRYGSSAASRIVDPQSGRTVRWLLSKIEDPFQNELTIAYSSAPETVETGPEPIPPDIGMPYPADVTYAGGDRAIHFVYETRPDPLHDFASGIERTIARRLKEIHVNSKVSGSYQLVVSAQ